MRILLATWILLCPAIVLAQRAPFPIPDPDPEIERKSFLVADGFEVNLYAADPILAKPIQMNFDPEGRLWVASSEVYPQIKPGQAANDKVLVLEDRDGDGRAETTRVFADGLLIPTGIEPGDGGAYVANSTELLHLKDNDGDGKADSRRTVLSGFGTEDTHHILHTLRWGYDGMLYFNQSIYIHSHIETPHGVRRLGGGGIWQFRPETMELDVFIRGLVNPWGHHFDRFGQSFATDGAGGEGINYCLPGAYYFTAPDAVRILAGLNPGSPKYCGEEFVSGRHLPDSWGGDVLTNDFRGNRVCRFVLSDDGAGFAAREQPELIKTTHIAFRPIDIKMGPDGAIYIADWYNPIIQHGEVDFRDPRRDHTRGRIWRVTAKGRPPLPRPRLVGATTEALLDALKAPEDWTRQQARRVLKERGPATVAPVLAAWTGRIAPNDPAASILKLEALWTFQALDVVEPELLAALLRDGDPRIRAAATRVLAHWHPRLSDPLGSLAIQVGDDHPRVRLEAVRALARIPSLRAAELAMLALDRPIDRFLDYALWLTARDLQATWLPEVQAGRFDFGGNSRHLVYALGAVGSAAAVTPLVESLRAGKIPEAQRESALSLIAALGQPADLALVFQTAQADASASPARQANLLKALLKAAKDRRIRPAGDLGRLSAWLDSPDDALRATAAEAVGLWHVDALRPDVLRLARDEKTSAAVRRAAIDTLAQLGGSDRLATLRLLAGPDAPAASQPLAIGALATFDPREGTALAAAYLTRDRDLGDVDGLVGRIVQLRDGPDRLASALVGKTIPADVAKVAVRAARASGRDQARLIEALTASGRLTAAPKLPDAEEFKTLLSDVARRGDAARGEAVFRRKEQTCLKCHAIGGAGGQVGPGLESIGASAPADYLVDSLLQPGKAVKENYHALVVATNDGRVVTGIKVRQTDQELILRDAEDREVALPISAIDEQKPGGSLMPAGLTDSLTRTEFVDLVRFLSELGKIGPYSLSKARIARRWRVAAPLPESIEPLRHRDLDAPARDKLPLSWLPAYSQVAGTLPLAELPHLWTGRGSAGLARTWIDVSTPGPVAIKLPATEGLRLWVDDAEVEVKPEVPLNLAAGRHALTFGVDPVHRHAPLLCTLEDVAGSPARVQWVVGK